LSNKRNKILSLFLGLSPKKLSGKIIALSSAIVVFVACVAMAGFAVNIQNYNELLYKQTEVNLTYFSEKIYSQMAEIEEISRTMAVGGEMQFNIYVLYDPNEERFVKLKSSNNIKNMLYNVLHSGVRSITVIPFSEPLIICGVDFTQEPPEYIEELKETAKDKNGAGFWAISKSESDTVIFFREIRRVKSPEFLDNLGWMIVQVNIAALSAAPGTVGNISENLYVSLMDGKNNTFYSNFSGTGNIEAADSLGKKNYVISGIGSEKLFISGIDIRKTDPEMKIVVGIPYDRIFQSVVFYRTVTVLAVITAIFIALLATQFFTKTLTRRYRILVGKFHEFQTKGSNDANGCGYGNDELGLLNRYFDDMTVKYKEVVEDNYVKKLETTKARLKNLEQQVQPHFLYNTLETIRLLAKRMGEENIPVIIDSLSYLLRSSLRGGDDVITVNEDIKIANRYLAIQRIRFYGRMQVKVHIPDEIMNVLIPKMTIQPLVDNAITYGIEESIDKCCVDVIGETINGEVVVTVSNNGSHIDEDIVNKLRDKTATPKGNGIGLVNIDTRIKLLFGNNYGLKIKNQDNGVSVEVHLPLEKPQEDKPDV
jgi:two-component system sensor histidine kinase YesM